MEILSACCMVVRYAADNVANSTAIGGEQHRSEYSSPRHTEFEAMADGDY